MIRWSRLVSWSCMVCWGGFVGFITGSSLVCNFHNVAGMSISSIIFNYLGAAIGKKDAVFTSSSISIPSFALPIIKLSVIINNLPSKVVFSMCIISRFLVSRLVVRWGMVDWGWGVVNWSRLIGWLGSRGGGCCGGCCWFVCCSWLVCWSWLISLSWPVCLNRSVCVLWGWCVFNGMAVSIMSMPMFYGGMALHVSQSDSHKGKKCNKGLEYKTLLIWFADSISKTL